MRLIQFIQAYSCVALRPKPSRRQCCVAGKGFPVTNWAMDTYDPLPQVWADVQKSLQICDCQGLPTDTSSIHVQLELDGRCSFTDDYVLMPATALTTWSMQSPGLLDTNHAKVLLRLPLSQYYSTAQHTKFLRIFHCAMTAQTDTRIIDACLSTAVIASSPVVREDECVQVAELFAWGFCGWGQSIHVLSGLGCPVKVRSLIDCSPDCSASARFVQGGLVEVSDPPSLSRALGQKELAIFAHADLWDDWWFPLLGGNHADLWCASPPCQQWSTASSGQGLGHCDGRLLLRIASLLHAFQPLGLCLEQVTGFMRHPHFGFVQSCFEEAGFVKVWEDSIELGDFLPTFRPHYLAVWLRADIASPIPVCPLEPRSRSLTLQTARCVVQLPQSLLEPCLPSPATLQLYLDPSLLPLPVRRKRQSPESFRIRKPSQKFSCIMASYHFQHELPPQLLQSAGLLGALVDSPQGRRFLSGAEAAMCHAACRPLLLHRDDRTQMRIQGNCLAVPQAALCVVRGLFHLLPPGARPSPTQALQECMQQRIHADNFMLLPCSEGWVLCKESQCQEAGSLIKSYWGQLALPDMPWKWYVLRDDDQCINISVVPGVSLETVLEALGVEILPLAIAQATPVWCRPGTRPTFLPPTAHVEVPSIPEINLSGLGVQPVAAVHEPLTMVLGTSSAYVLVGGGPCRAATLNQILAFESLATEQQGEPVWTTLDGRVISNWLDIKGVVALHFAAPHTTWQLPTFSPALVCGAQVLSHANPIRLRLQSDEHCQYQLTFPCGVFQAMGWDVAMTAPLRNTKEPFPPVQFSPRPLVLRISPAMILPVCSEQLVVGVLNFLSQRPGANLLTHVQISGRSLWKGQLQAHLTFQDVLNLWLLCHFKMGISSPCRTYSGHRAVDSSISLLQARYDKSAGGFVSRKGHLLVTLAPMLSGGGAKDRKYADTQAELAQFLLDQGMPLSESTALIDKIPLAGLGRITQLLKPSNVDHRWSSFEALCRQFQVACPRLTNAWTGPCAR